MTQGPVQLGPNPMNKSYLFILEFKQEQLKQLKQLKSEYQISMAKTASPLRET